MPASSNTQRLKIAACLDAPNAWTESLNPTAEMQSTEIENSVKDTQIYRVLEIERTDLRET